MIYAKNQYAGEYRGIHPGLDLALANITPEFLGGLKDGVRVDLQGDDVYCTRFTYETISDAESFFEAHEKYLDIHIMLSGSERVEIAPPEELERFESKPENDFYAYRGQGRYKLTLSPGDFLVVFPGDAHKIKMYDGAPATVTKAVFKVRIH